MKTKRVLSVLLVLIMCLSFVPATVRASESTDTTPAAAPEYINDIKWERKNTIQLPLFLLNTEDPRLLNKNFEFNPEVTEYDLVLPAFNSTEISGIIFKVNFTDEAKENDNVYARVIEISQTGEDTYKNAFRVGTAAKDFSGTWDGKALGMTNVEAKENILITSHYPYTIKLETGVLNEGEDINGGTLTEQGRVYTFRIHRYAAMTSFIASYEDGTKPINWGMWNKVLENENFTDIVIENVPTGTERLNLKMAFPSYTLKFDDGTGTGTYDTGENYTSNTQFALDLVKYTDDSYWTDDGLVIPFMLDYDQTNGCCLDGYYTLTLKGLEKSQPVQNSSISPITATFDKNTAGSDYKDIPVELTLNGNTLSKILNGTEELAEGTDYTVSEMTVTLKKEYLATLDGDSATLTFQFSAGENQTLTISISDTTPLSTYGYVKNIVIGPSYQDQNHYTYLNLEHLWLNNFTPEQKEYTLGSAPIKDSGPLIALELVDEADIDRLRVFLTLTDGNGVIWATGNAPFQKTGQFYRKFDKINDAYDVVNLIYRNTTGSFSQVEPGNYTLTLGVYPEGQEEKADTYTFSYTLVPYFAALNVYAAEKHVLTEPDVNDRFNVEVQAITPYQREYRMTCQGTQSLTLELSIFDWLSRFGISGTAAGDVALLFNGTTYPAQYRVGETTLSATLDISSCNNAENVYTVPFSLAYGDGAMRVQADYTLYVTVSEDAGWSITGTSGGGTYNKGDNAVVSVTIEGDKADNVTYQWQWTDLRYNAEQGTYRGNVENADRPELTVPTSSSGSRYYRCIVTDKDTGASQYTEPIVVDVNIGQVNVPIIGFQPGQEDGAITEYLSGQQPQPIQITAGITDMIPNTLSEWAAEISVEWYVNDKASEDGASLLNPDNYQIVNRSAKPFPLPTFADRVDAHIFAYVFPEILEVGDYYFFCVVTAIAKDNPENTASVTSDILKISVKERGELEGFVGKGVEDDPYLIKTLDDLKRIDEYVMAGEKLAGAVFRFANDITVPADWEPIGGIGGKYFSGILDGDGKTLTYEKDARPLLEWCRDAYVKNLKIYGEEINGAGLLDKAGIDYGDDGVYQENDPDIITVENVTLLSGSKTKGSGFVNGGFTSGINNIFIKNCTIEKDVIVGYSKDQSSIGSFVGVLNGRIENSISYATVYGGSIVGGLVGHKGQSMGLCEIINSAFVGTIEASGRIVGGIIAAGYISDSAPNTPPVTIRNCYVVANITGDSTEVIVPVTSSDYSIFVPGDCDKGSGIGGIFGSEIGMVGPWDDAFITDNYFYGTITDTNPNTDKRYDRVGGIMGDLGAYKPEVQHYENNYYLVNDNYDGFGYLLLPNAAWKPDQDSFVPKTAEEFANGTVTALLNQGSYKNWIQGANGYPVHSDAVIPTSLTISGEFTTEYYVGDNLDMTGAVFTVGYSDGTEAIIDESEITYTGFDSSALGNCTVTATYGPVSASFVVRILLENPEAITVSFVLYGDTVHGESGETHTLAESNLTEWIARADYEIDENTTVLDVFEEALTKAGLTWFNMDGNYISSITYGDITLAEKDNGPRSGWMYTLNGDHPKNGVAEQYLKEGDCILFHYTDDFTKESGTGETAITGMTMETETLTVEAGKTGELIVSYIPVLLNGNVRAEWSSSDTAIASVDRKGVVTGLAEGTATITATAGGKSVTATVTVTPGETPVIAVESVAITPETLMLKVGETGTLTATVLPEDAIAKTVEWKSSDESVATVKDGVVSALKAGSATITATAGGKSATAEITVEAQGITYPVALGSVLQYLRSNVKNPNVGSTYGEWAVFALNRGDAATDAWNNIYLANLKAYVDECSGKLTEKEYTEYSRVILALTSMGVDASEFTTDNGTYDLVKPLLDKQTNGDYWAEWQGNNGTEFALLALDSHDYLPGADGKKLRADLIASLKKNQLESGAWAISGSAADLDVTAAGVYALAPYYLDEAKVNDLGGTVTYVEVKAMVEGALTFLSAAQKDDGSFGSPEADIWVIIALSSIGRDAATDADFVKAGGNLIDDLLRYFDGSTGGFKHELTAKVNQMSSEQAAYGLVAYDRFKNSRNTLYDMSDVEIASLDEKANRAAAEEVEALIDAIGEVTLESKAKIDAARAAYDALTDEQKALVGNLQTLKDAEAKYQELAEAADQEEIDKAAAKGVVELIDAIGEVTLDSEKAIKAARNAYDALTDEQKKLVEKLADLEAAEAKLEELQPLVTVTFYLQSGKSSEVAEGETKTYTKADEGKALPTASRDNYSFDGWYDAAVDGTRYTSVSAALPRELYAQWTSDSSGDSGSSGGGDSDEGKITVTMRLIGAKQAEKDVDLGAEEYMPDYVTWIATTSYKLEEGSSVYDLWLQATGDAGIRSVGAEKNYVSAVFAPSSLGGYELAEFTNGKRSGWMYTINGRHPGFGLKEQELHDGDRVIWHYVNDYSYEVSDWFEADSRWPSLGDGRYYNRWLKAPDRFGGSGGGLGEGAQSSGGSGDSSGGSSEIIPSYDGDTIVIKADVEHSEGGAAYAADATLDKKTVAEGLEKAEDKSSLKVWVDIEDSNRLVLRIEPEAMKEIADAKAGLRMECSRGVIKLDADAVAKLTESGHEVRMVVSYDDWNDKTTVSVRPFPPTDGDAAVMLKIELPATKDGQALSIVGSDGTTTPIKKSAIIGDRVYAEVPSGVTLTITESNRYWNDVKAGDWFADAVSFAVSHDLMNGVDRYEFAPNMPMTRAMLVTVLYRLEDEPEIANSMSFGDVASGAWYTEAVAWAAEQEIVRGNGDGFAPNDNITREQIATVLYRYAQYLGMDVEAKGDVSKFSDGEKISSWAQDAMAWAVKVGLFKGDDTGSLNPQGNATRAEVATLLERLIKLIVVS